jgi:hypothetical protein
MPARQSVNLQELSQGTHQRPAILHLLQLTICESLRRHNIGDTTLKMAFGANLFLAKIINGPPTLVQTDGRQGSNHPK